ncbi:hypothetical protein GGR55DRAFT_675034 [Xylaria sp. FL0064]|nr:hypothetical protein GGR55DRAFT_675034 [Xylaria sp. FL0064]
MTAAAIKKAWATSGIHPRDRSRPLSSKYVMLESEGVAEAPPAISGPKSPDFLLLRDPKLIDTPAGGQELIRKSRQLADHDRTFRNPTQALFARKASKALDLQAGRIAELEAQVTILTAHLEKKRKKKRKAVKLPPGERFVKMTDIRRVKRRLRNRVVYDDDASDVNVAEKGTSFVEEVFSDETEAEDWRYVTRTLAGQGVAEQGGDQLIEDIRRAQIAAGDVEDNSSESSGTDLPSEAEDCIIVVADSSESSDEDDG